jgi:hypothetical protein
MALTPVAEVTVPSLFNGPPGSANGGYLSGVLAQRLTVAADDAVVVTLRKPPPLGAPMVVTRVEDSCVRLHHGEVLVAEAARTRLAGLGRPSPVSFDEAKAAERRYRGHDRHPFPTCFVCGPARSERDGMRLFPGAVDAASELFACTWVPDPALKQAGATLVRAEFVWAALDCPGAWTVDLTNRVVVLGRIAARVVASPSVGEPCVVTSRLVGDDGRKFKTCSAVYGASGRLLGEAESVWIELRTQP